MLQPELLLHPSWTFNNVTDSSLDELGIFGLDMEVHMDDWEFSSSFITSEDSSEITPIPYFPTMYSNELQNFLFCADDHEEQVILPIEQQYAVNLEDFDSFLNDQLVNHKFVEVSEGMDESESVPLLQEGFLEESNETSMEMLPVQASSLVLPTQDMEVDTQLSIFHLLKAYGEAVETGLEELAKVTSRRVHEKASPLGSTVERLAYYYFQAMDNHGGEYLRQESGKNYEAAFGTFYQIFPYGRVAHFTANSAILESMPEDAEEVIHIVDFDMGEGIQWPPMIEAMGRRQHRTVRLTSIKWQEDDHHPWKFEETKKRLCDYAESLGLKLKVEEMDMEEFVSEMKKMQRREWLAFNCMVGLPHMGRSSSSKHVLEFLRLAQVFITNPSDSNTRNRGIVILGDGDGLRERMKNYSDQFGSFFNGYFLHFHALLESMEFHFPLHLTEARIAMECLFVAPYVSSFSCLEKWEEARTRKDCRVQSWFGLEGLGLSRESLVEAKEMVKEGESLYEVKVEGENENELMLEWRGIPLMRVSTWR